MTAVPSTDAIGLPPVTSDDAADHTWLNQLRYALDVTLYRVEQFEHRHARRLAPLMAIAGAFGIAITWGLVA